MTECPVCATSISINSGVVKNEIIDCETCGAEL